jgi:hypothetical protein
VTLYYFIFEAEARAPEQSTERVLATVIVKSSQADSAEATAREQVTSNGRVITRVAVARMPLSPKRLYGIGESSLRQIDEAERLGVGTRYLPLPAATVGGK